MLDLKPHIQFLRVGEVAERYGVSRTTIWRWVKDTDFPEPVKLANHSTRWKVAALQAWEASQ